MPNALVADTPQKSNKPVLAEEIRAALDVDAKALLERRDELLASVERAPAVESDEIAGKVADLVKLLMACHKNAEAERVSTKEPYLAAGRAVDGFYRQITEPLEKAKTGLERRLTAWQRQQAEEERRAREAEAQRQREEADRRRREAEAQAAALRTERDLEAALSAEALAKAAEADADRADKSAAAKPAELSRTRGELGSVASLRTFWDLADLDRATLDLEPLRPHLPANALEQAVRSFIKAGGRELRGCRIFENTTTQVR